MIVCDHLDALLTERYVLTDDHVIARAAAAGRAEAAFVAPSWCAGRWPRCC